MTKREPLWECPKCHEHFFQYVIDDGVPVCDRRDKDCPAPNVFHRRGEKAKE